MSKPVNKCIQLALLLDLFGFDTRFWHSRRGVPIVSIGKINCCWFGRTRIWRVFNGNEKLTFHSEYKVMRYLEEVA